MSMTRYLTGLTCSCLLLVFVGVSTSMSQVWWEETGTQYPYDLSRHRLLILLGEDFDFQETMIVKRHWESWGAKVDIAGIRKVLTGHLWRKTAEGWDRSQQQTITCDILLENVDLARYNALFFPGGNSPTNLLKEDGSMVVKLIRQANQLGLVLAAICHGPRVLAAAGVVKGRMVTGHPEVEEELQRAGGSVPKRVFVVDENLVTGNWPYFETMAIKVAERLLYPEYLSATQFIDARDPKIVAKTEELTGNCSTDVERVKSLFEFVRDGYNNASCSSFIASEVMDCGGNLCRQRSILLAALCRAAGIPARLHLQKVTIRSWKRSDGTVADITFAHVITGINVNGQWHLYEAVGNRDKWINWTQDSSRASEMPIEFSGDRDCLFKPDAGIFIETLPQFFADRAGEMVKLIERTDGDVRY